MSRSESRARSAFLSVRVDELEDSWLREQAEALGITRAEFARAVLFGREPAAPVTPCSSAHGVLCTPHHRSVVDSFRDQRYREELEVEGMDRGEMSLWRENGGKLVTFADWLQANRRPA